jgi:hypothetical protein
MNIDPQKKFGQRECPNCACVVATNSNACPICKYVFPVESLRRKRILTTVAVIVLVALVWLVLP